MKNSINRMAAGILGIATLALGLATHGARAQTVVDSFQFDEASGTGLTSVTNSAPGGIGFDSDITGVATDGIGSLTIGGVDFGTGGIRSYALVNGGSDITSGFVTLDVTVSSWDFGTSSPRLGFTLINDDPAAVIIAGFQFDVGSADVGVGSFSDTGFDNSSADDLILGLTLSSPIVFRLTVNLDAKTYGLEFDDGSGFTAIGSVLSIDDPAFEDNLLIREIQLATRFDGTGGFVDIDSITLTTAPVPEPGTVALCLLGLLAFFVMRRRITVA